MYCFVILLLFNEMQMSVQRFSAIPHLRAIFRLFATGTKMANYLGTGLTINMKHYTIMIDR